ncbi:IS110 family transposase [Moraxella macacae]|uniref:IS110 family transposase n=1 Tax=Moraxella macacae TaxID=765840 RepID=UPI000590B9B4
MVIGIDIAKLSFDASFVYYNQQFHHTFGNHLSGFLNLSDYIKKRIAPPFVIHLIIESTNIYWQALALWAYQSGFLVSVVNPCFIHAYAKSLGIRIKTDKQDAALLARFGRHENPPLWQPLEVIEEKLTSLTRQRQHSKHKLMVEINRSETASCHNMVFIQSTIGFWENQIKHLDTIIWQTIAQHPDLSIRADLLASIPGIGKKSIPHLLALIGDGSRFASAKHLVSFAGLAPRLYQSGTSIYKTASIGHSGQPDIREVLYMPAVVVSFGRHRAFEPFVGRLLANGKCKKQVIVAIMRKLLSICYMVIKTNTPFDPKRHKQFA